MQEEEEEEEEKAKKEMANKEVAGQAMTEDTALKAGGDGMVMAARMWVKQMWVQRLRLRGICRRRAGLLLTPSTTHQTLNPNPKVSALNPTKPETLCPRVSSPLCFCLHFCVASVCVRGRVQCLTQLCTSRNNKKRRCAGPLYRCLHRIWVLLVTVEDEQRLECMEKDMLEEQVAVLPQGRELEEKEKTGSMRRRCEAGAEEQKD